MRTLPACCTSTRSKFVFLGRKLHVLIAHLDDAPDEIDGQIANSKDRALAVDLKLVTKRRPHSGEKFVHAKRLGHVIVGAEVESLDLAGLVTAAGQHHDRNALVSRPDHSQQFVSLNVRQAEIENDQVRLLVQELKRGLAVRRLKSLIALRRQSHPQELTNGRLVIDHQNLERGCGHAAVSNFRVSVGTGSVIVNIAPVRSVRFAATMVPFIASTKPRAIARPSPVPARTWSAFRAR